MEAEPVDWQLAYRQGTTPWDLRGPTAPLRALLASGRLADLGIAAGAAVAVPGAGRGHDLRLWARHGYRATGFELVPAAVAEARTLLALNRSPATILCRDVFGLLPEFAAAFDVVYDYTCYCAIPVHLRDAYGGVVAGLLRPGGLLVHLTFPMDPARAGRPGRPPYLITDADVERSFGAGLALAARYPAADSPPERAGAERWDLWRLRPPAAGRAAR